MNDLLRWAARSSVSRFFYRSPAYVRVILILAFLLASTFHLQNSFAAVQVCGVFSSVSAAEAACNAGCDASCYSTAGYPDGSGEPVQGYYCTASQCLYSWTSDDGVAGCSGSTPYQDGTTCVASCPSGETPDPLGVCVGLQTCSDGSQIPESETCPATAEECLSLEDQTSGADYDFDEPFMCSANGCEIRPGSSILFPDGSSESAGWYTGRQCVAGKPPTLTLDENSDGVPDYQQDDLDTDGDGIPDSEDPDVDGDGILNEADADNATLPGSSFPSDYATSGKQILIRQAIEEQTLSAQEIADSAAAQADTLAASLSSDIFNLETSVIEAKVDNSQALSLLSSELTSSISGVGQQVIQGTADVVAAIQGIETPEAEPFPSDYATSGGQSALAQSVSSASAGQASRDGTRDALLEQQTGKLDSISYALDTLPDDIAAAGAGSGSGDSISEFCSQNPTAVMCLDASDNGLGEFGIPVELETREVSLSLVPEITGGSVSCPAPLTASFLGQQISISWQFICDFALSIRPLVLIMSSLTVGSFVIGALRYV